MKAELLLSRSQMRLVNDESSSFCRALKALTSNACPDLAIQTLHNAHRVRAI